MCIFANYITDEATRNNIVYDYERTEDDFALSNMDFSLN